jgi:hypothetical protein
MKQQLIPLIWSFRTKSRQQWRMKGCVERNTFIYIMSRFGFRRQRRAHTRRVKKGIQQGNM